jgi:hypothetical protein
MKSTLPVLVSILIVGCRPSPQTPIISLHTLEPIVITLDDCLAPPTVHDSQEILQKQCLVRLPEDSRLGFFPSGCSRRS